MEECGQTKVTKVKGTKEVSYNSGTRSIKRAFNFVKVVRRYPKVLRRVTRILNKRGFAECKSIYIFE
jgi:hypothetical protein